MKKWQFLVMMPVLVTGLALSGCAESDATSEPAESEGSNTSAAAPHASPAPATPVELTIPSAMKAFTDDGKVVELSIEGNDRMQFNLDRLEVPAGAMVRLTLKHVGSLPAQSMGHNVVILKKGDDPFEFSADGNENGASMDNYYVPDPVRKRVIALTKIVGGGETTSVEFQAPQEPGDYPFLCSFPGHAGMMNGIMAVTE